MFTCLYSTLIILQCTDRLDCCSGVCHNGVCRNPGLRKRCRQQGDRVSVIVHSLLGNNSAMHPAGDAGDVKKYLDNLLITLTNNELKKHNKSIISGKPVVLIYPLKCWNLWYYSSWVQASAADFSQYSPSLVEVISRQIFRHSVIHTKMW